MPATVPGDDPSSPSGSVSKQGDEQSIVITIQHPAHVHFYKHAIRELEAEGHQVTVFALRKDVAIDILEANDIEYEVLAERGPLYTLPATQAAYEFRLWQRVREIQPDVMTAIGGVAVSHVAALVGARSVVFTDTEHATLSNAITFPFADRVLTPESYTEDHGPHQRRYAGCHELAYLHPDRFEPDPGVLDEVGLDPEDSFVVFRHGGWGALHDVGDSGLEDIVDVVAAIESTGRDILLTSEDAHPDAVASRAVDVDPTRMHDLLAYADLFVGESGTMALESAVLGTPSVYIHTAQPGIISQLETYGLLFPYHGENRHQAGIERGLELLEAEIDWEGRRDAFLEQAVDTTDVILHELLSNPEDRAPTETDHQPTHA